MNGLVKCSGCLGLLIRFVSLTSETISVYTADNGSFGVRDWMASVPTATSLPYVDLGPTDPWSAL